MIYDFLLLFLKLVIILSTRTLKSHCLIKCLTRAINY
ncbi:hypothetical protein GLYMA_06G185433v4 [Glycine max]|nr:hypothetical protein GLYMA_06G185433v4 [Glycine max]KAH1126575.1 hypothetical protein GYH30_015531 [Glycine max]